jgi:hypothetical protein
LKILDHDLNSPITKASARRLRSRLTHLAGRSQEFGLAVRDQAATLYERLPGTVRATRDGAMETTTALQTLPDSTLRWLAASSVGLSAGFYLARAPRVVILAGVAPALMMGAAIALRPMGLVESTESVASI